ncbi:lipopolysaccharide biosynthesis protein, partial [bacterium]|nr:lipopolysaccharide biosynthesis protein [bacterium]
MTQGNFRADGNPIAKLGNDDYALRNGGLTTCDATVPSWKFGATELDISVEKYATGKHVIFYVKDIPVFYFP